MKTSEFASYVNKNWFTKWEHGDNVIDIAGIMKVHTNCKLIEFDKKIATNSNHFRLIEKAIEYTETPLEEREEVKKYYLRFPKGYNRWYSYLAKEINKDNGEYDCSGKCIDNEKYKNIFTQKEIDAMPFDTSFFIKEEV